MKIIEASKYSIYNMDALTKCEKAGRYHCKSIFQSINITETTDDGKTALCPKCGIDSILPESAPFKFDETTLASLKNYWF